MFFFNDTATTEIYTLSLRDALPISVDPLQAVRAAPLARAGRRQSPQLDAVGRVAEEFDRREGRGAPERLAVPGDLPGVVRRDRESTRLNSSHANISHAAFCLLKKHQ